MPTQPAASQAAYHCFRCKAPLNTGQHACPRCGQSFDAPVPAGPLAFIPSPSAQARRLGIGLWIGIVLAALLLFLGAFGYGVYHSLQIHARAGQSASGAGKPGGWSPDPSLLAQLGPEQQITGPQGSYALRPPARYTLRTIPMQAADGTSMIYLWVGPANADGTAPQFQVMIGGDGGSMTSRMTSAQDVQLGFMSTMRKDRDLVQSSIQSGRIHGLPFARGYWRGIGMRTGRKVHGLIYCEVAAPDMIMISGKDAEPSSRTSLPLFDAATLSLHKL